MLGRQVKPLPLGVGVVGLVIFVSTLIGSHGDKSDIIQGVGGILITLWIICTSFPRQPAE